MASWNSTEAPVRVSVDDPDAYTGHMDDHPVFLSVENTRDGTRVTEDGEVMTVPMSPAEAYHLTDDLNAAADACWSGAEFVVLAAMEDGGNVYLTTVKAPDRADAVRRAVDLVTTDSWRDRNPRAAEAAENAPRFSTYRSDTLESFRRTDLELDDADGGDQDG